MRRNGALCGGAKKELAEALAQYDGDDLAVAALRRAPAKQPQPAVALVDRSEPVELGDVVGRRPRSGRAAMPRSARRETSHLANKVPARKVTTEAGCEDMLERPRRAATIKTQIRFQMVI